MPNPEWQWYHICFPKVLYFKIFDSLSFNFSVIWDMNESSVLYMNTQLFQNYCSKVYKFFIDLSLHLCQNCFFINIWVCFLTLCLIHLFVFFDSNATLFQLLEDFNVSKSSRINPSTLILFKIVFKILVHLHSCMNF